MTETQLVERARAGDAAAIRDLYDANVERVFRLTHRLSGDEELAREYTQDTFVRAFQRLDQFRGDAALSTWLHSIAVSVTFNGLRKVKRVRSRELGMDDVESAAGAAFHTAPVHTEPDLKDRLHRAIDDLPEIYRAVVVMHDVEGYTHEEIGGALGVAAGTSKARLFRAREMLRDALADFAEEYMA
ncbi:MAG TPA: sigma-70 family RNA polymerase sigma factor [Longimicrobiales bacterium]|nr:sigma-70 family RNA polymerase sigma factor [Longimicrobiales bacterium]